MLLLLELLAFLETRREKGRSTGQAEERQGTGPCVSGQGGCQRVGVRCVAKGFIILGLGKNVARGCRWVIFPCSLPPSPLPPLPVLSF